MVLSTVDSKDWKKMGHDLHFIHPHCRAWDHRRLEMKLAVQHSKFIVAGMSSIVYGRPPYSALGVVDLSSPICSFDWLLRGWCILDAAPYSYSNRLGSRQQVQSVFIFAFKGQEEGNERTPSVRKLTNVESQEPLRQEEKFTGLEKYSFERTVIDKCKYEGNSSSYLAINSS